MTSQCSFGKTGDVIVYALYVEVHYAIIGCKASFFFWGNVCTSILSFGVVFWFGLLFVDA
jgi:hypothetical protein